MLTVKRSISLLLALILTLGLLPWDAMGTAAVGFGEVIAESEEPVKIIEDLSEETPEESSRSWSKN
mgnify:CR=1 FL=1